MIIGFHSPMPPARTGVADYSAAMVASLRALGHEVRIGGEGDIDVYHIGNNPLHRQIHERAVQRPGVAIIHDAVLHHFHLGFDDEQHYIAEFIHNYGEWNRGLAIHLWRNRARSGSDPAYFNYPMLRRIVEASRLVVVHNPGAAAIVRSHVPAAHIAELPHLAATAPQPDPHAVLELRHQWNLPAGAFLFGVFGHLRESKRLKTILTAARRTNAFLLVAGDFVSNDYARSMDDDLAAQRVIRVPYLAERDFWSHAHAVDAFINLKYPSGGETSGIAIGMMGIGKPMMVTAGLETSSFPRESCLAIDPGTAEEDMLATYMLWLRETPGAAHRIGECARAYIARTHDATRVAQEFTNLLHHALR